MRKNPKLAYGSDIGFFLIKQMKLHEEVLKLVQIICKFIHTQPGR